MQVHEEIINTITKRANAICKRKGYMITIPESEVKIVLEAYAEEYEEHEKDKAGDCSGLTTSG